MARRTVFLFGHSMLLSLVANSLAQSPSLQIIHPANWGELDSLVIDCSPDVLIHDLESSNQSNFLPLLIKNPRLRLIGLDAESNRAVLVAGHETRSLTLERILEIIEAATPEEQLGSQ